jgi:hypothetical protein
MLAAGQHQDEIRAGFEDGRLGDRTVDFELVGTMIDHRECTRAAFVGEVHAG